MSIDTLPVGPINRETYERRRGSGSDAVVYTLPAGSEVEVELNDDSWITVSWTNELPKDKLLWALALFYEGKIIIDEFKYKANGDYREVKTQEEFDAFMDSPDSFLLFLENNEDIEIAWEDGVFHVSVRDIENARELIDLTASAELRERINEVIPSGN